MTDKDKNTVEAFRILANKSEYWKQLEEDRLVNLFAMYACVCALALAIVDVIGF